MRRVGQTSQTWIAMSVGEVADRDVGREGGRIFGASCVGSKHAEWLENSGGVIQEYLDVCTLPGSGAEKMAWLECDKRCPSGPIIALFTLLAIFIFLWTVDAKTHSKISIAKRCICCHSWQE